MSKNIEFIKTLDSYPDLYTPCPASEMLPDWYKKMTPYRSEENSFNPDIKMSTIKKCMPVFDSISSGYLIKLHSDISVISTKDGYLYKTSNPKTEEVLQFHSKLQADSYPKDLSMYASLPKIVNHWGIKTPKGYSCLIVPPSHHDNIINILPAIVDTDRYNSPANLPFLINGVGFSGIIKAGTPIAQIIPFKRESWKFNLIEDFNLKRVVDSKIMSVFYNAYKNMFWTKKDFK